MAKVKEGWTSGMDLADVEIKSLRLENDHDKQENKEQRDKNLPTASKTWNAFVNVTSLHGIRYIFWERPLWARIGWLLILLGFTCYFLFTAHRSVTKFLKRPINTVITQTYENKIEFPAVTICPLNLISKKKMYALDSDVNFYYYGLNDSFCSATAAVREGRPCGASMMCCCVSFLVFDGSSIVPNCTTQYAESLIAAQEISGNYFDIGRYYQKYAQGLEEMLVPGFCLFDGDFLNPCGESDFIATPTDAGMCYTFNANPGEVKYTTIAGAGGGLYLLLDAQMDDQTIGRLSEGFSVIIHRQGESFLGWDGINVSPGTLASITLQQQRFKNLEEPYETKCKNKTLKFTQVYTKRACFLECLAENIVKSCQCHPLLYPEPSLRSCAKQDSGCLDAVTDNFESSSCDCPNPCYEIRYTTDVYLSRFPDVGSATVVQSAGVPRSFEYMRENFVFLQIGYKILGYELREQQVAFGIESLLGEIGGNMGLFLGCSLMTIFEFGDLLVALIYIRNMQRGYQM
ncbi:acid-sensing ion channel 4-A-like [Montipora capricornis]|uniref:acid-sensing ion channel 4-A-like n=1 Tax=Montipora capricornis TaxID=246305 RepID=UPI0035F1E1AD